MAMSTPAVGKRWRFSFSVLLPIVVAVLVTLGTAGTFIVWSTAKSDERALERQTRLVSHILEQQQRAVGLELLEVTVWDEAVESVRARDIDWIDESLGAYFYDLFGHNRIYVLDPEMDAVYAMRDGGKVDASSIVSSRDAIIALAAQHRTVEGASAIGANGNGFGDVPVASDLALIEDRAAIVGVVPLLAESYVVAAGEESFVAAVRFLDDAVAGELMEQYLIEAAHFSPNATTADGEAAIPLRNAAGETVAWFKWRPDRPGAQILGETAPAMLIVLLAAGIIISFLTLRLRRSSADLEAARAEAHQRALHDPLTGLANRAGFRERLTQAIQGLGRGRDPIALLALDLDRFKQVNDTLGHEAGDLLLQKVAERLKPLLRDTDMLARLGGDEFAVIQSAIKTVSEATALSQRIIAQVSKPFDLNGDQACIGVSVGIAVAGLPEDGAELPTRADYALYEAKDAGRNTFRLFGDAPTASPVPAAANANKVA
jgi:diguanylate cyclase (GGDEF)-like protein